MFAGRYPTDNLQCLIWQQWENISNFYA